MPKVFSIIGAGVVGTAVGRLLKDGGHSVKGVVSRSPEKARKAVSFIGGGVPGTDIGAAAEGVDWVFITTPDKAIKGTCDKIAGGGGLKKGALVAHMSGALGSDALASAREAGARVVSVHPLQSLASAEQAVANLPGSYFSIEGDEAALGEAREIVEALGGRVVVIPSGSKALYHAGAAIASNYLVSVVDFAVRVYESLGMKREEALTAVFPLIQGTVDNIGKVGVPEALTGPVARGDVETVEGHIEALSREMPRMVRLYCELGKHTVAVGLAKGTLGEGDAERLMELFNRKKP